MARLYVKLVGWNFETSAPVIPWPNGYEFEILEETEDHLDCIIKDPAVPGWMAQELNVNSNVESYELTDF